MNVRKEIESLKIPHYYCEDNWYSCPLSEEGCINESVPKDICTCGAFEHNKKVDKVLDYLDTYGYTSDFFRRKG